jgi:hypothetical protein
MPGTEDRDSMTDLDEVQIDEEPEPSRTPSLEENRAGFMLLDL